MNRGDIRSEIREILKDTSTDTTQQRWSDAILNNRINRAQGKIAALTKCIGKRGTDIDIVNGTSEYDLDATYLSTVQVQIKDLAGNFSPLEKKTEEELNLYHPYWRQDVGAPGIYYIARNKIGLYPCPDYSRNGGLRMDYYCRPTDMTQDSDIPFDSKAILTDFHDLIVIEACRVSKFASGEKEDYLMLEQEFAKRIKEMKVILNGDVDDTRMINIYETARSAPRRTS
jgi:hypothetical protein